MIPVVLSVILGVLFASLTAARVRYGGLRVSEFPVLLWCVLAGREHRRQLKGILERREQRPSMLVKAAFPGQVELSSRFRVPPGAALHGGVIILSSAVTLVPVEAGDDDHEFPRCGRGWDG